MNDWMSKNRIRVILQGDLEVSMYHPVIKYGAGNRPPRAKIIVYNLVVFRMPMARFNLHEIYKMCLISIREDIMLVVKFFAKGGNVVRKLWEKEQQ
jgi:hypothetical protein